MSIKSALLLLVHVYWILFWLGSIYVVQPGHYIQSGILPKTLTKLLLCSLLFHIYISLAAVRSFISAVNTTVHITTWLLIHCALLATENCRKDQEKTIHHGEHTPEDHLSYRIWLGDGFSAHFKHDTLPVNKAWDPHWLPPSLSTLYINVKSKLLTHCVTLMHLLITILHIAMFLILRTVNFCTF